jgi:hypothetical protein
VTSMNTSLETGLSRAERETGAAGTSKITVKSILIFLSWALVWVLLIGAGMFGAKLYLDRMQAQIAQQISAQTAAQLSAVQSEYQVQIEGLKAQLTSELTLLKEKVNTFNELLTFVKDTADTGKNNSNKLYTQLQELKTQIEQLKKELEVLK